MTTGLASAPPAAPNLLPQSAAELVLELGAAMQRQAMYPGGHPQAEAAIERAMRRLDAWLAQRPAFAFAVARTQLVVDGLATDALHPLLRDLALKLHAHRVGSVHIAAGLLRTELTDFLGAVAADPDQLLLPLVDQNGRWPHVQLAALPFDRLRVMDDGAGEAAGPSVLWLALARAALVGGDGAADGLLDPRVLARAIGTNANPAYDQSVVSLLQQLIESLKAATGEDSAVVRTRLSELVCALDADTVARLLELGGDAAQRTRFVLDASQQLAADAVVRLAHAAARASDQAISRTLLRVLGKLALQAHRGGAVARAGASAALGDQLESLLDDWHAPRLNPQSYQETLDRLAQRRVFSLMQGRRHPCEPARLLMTALEADALGSPAWLALHQLLAHGGIGVVLDLLDRAPAGNAMAATLWPLVATRDNVRRLLRDEQVDPALIDRVAARLGVGVVELLLDALESSETRAMRRRLLELVARVGPAAGPLIIARLGEQAPWYVQRNLLTLLAMLPALPDDFSAAGFLRHPDTRVRREAFKLLLRDPTHRPAAVVAALDDPDEAIVRRALTAARGACPRAAVAPILRLVERGDTPADVRALGIRVIGATRAPGTLDWLLARVVTRGRVLRRQKLLPRSPEMLAALAGLAAGWRADARADAVVRAARQSGDPDVRAAATAAPAHSAAAEDA